MSTAFNIKNSNFTSVNFLKRTCGYKKNCDTRCLSFNTTQEVQLFLAIRLREYSTADKKENISNITSLWDWKYGLSCLPLSHIRRSYARPRAVSRIARFPEYTRKIGFTKACVKAWHACNGIHGVPIKFSSNFGRILWSIWQRLFPPDSSNRNVVIDLINFEN